MHGSRTALVVVDMQNYYLDPAADFTRYFESLSPGCMSYISRRCRDAGSGYLHCRYQQRCRQLRRVRVCLPGQCALPAGPVLL